MSHFADKDLIEIATNVAIIIAVLLLAKLVQIILLKIFMRFSNWFHSSFNKMVESYARKPLLCLLSSWAVLIALYFTSLPDKWENRLEITFHVLIAICTGWLIIGIAKGIANWLEGHYAANQSHDAFGARKFSTQIRVLMRVVILIVLVVTGISIALVIPGLRQFGVSLFASAGVASLVIGMAANSTLSNLIAGVQIAITQPILLGDEVFINGLTGKVEEIRASYLVIRLEDGRRMIVPLNWFMSNPIINSTYQDHAAIGSFIFPADVSVNVDDIRQKLQDIAKHSPKWDGKQCNLLVNDNKGQTIELKVQLSARNSANLSELQSEVRQKLIMPLQKSGIISA